MYFCFGNFKLSKMYFCFGNFKLSKMYFCFGNFKLSKNVFVMLKTQRFALLPAGSSRSRP